jgi:hypothetical protein
MMGEIGVLLKRDEGRNCQAREKQERVAFYRSRLRRLRADAEKLRMLERMSRK